MHDCETPMLEVNVDNSLLQHEQDNSIRAFSLKHKTQRVLSHWILAFSSVTASIFSTAYPYGVLVNQDTIPNSLAFTPGQAVLVVNILSTWMLSCSGPSLVTQGESLRWALVCRGKGVRLTYKNCRCPRAGFGN